MPQIHILLCPLCLFVDTHGLSHPKKLLLADRKDLLFRSITLWNICPVHQFSEFRFSFPEKRKEELSTPPYFLDLDFWFNNKSTYFPLFFWCFYTQSFLPISQLDLGSILTEGNFKVFSHFVLFHTSLNFKVCHKKLYCLGRGVCACATLCLMWTPVSLRTSCSCGDTSCELHMHTYFIFLNQGVTGPAGPPGPRGLPGNVVRMSGFVFPSVPWFPYL